MSILILARYNIGMINKREDIAYKFSDRLRQLRRKHKFTQEALAERAGISYKNIQYLESKDPTCPSLRTLDKLAKAFGMSSSKLLQF